MPTVTGSGAALLTMTDLPELVWPVMTQRIRVEPADEPCLPARRAVVGCFGDADEDFERPMTAIAGMVPAFLMKALRVLPTGNLRWRRCGVPGEIRLPNVAGERKKRPGKKMPSRALGGLRG